MKKVGYFIKVLQASRTKMDYDSNFSKSGVGNQGIDYDYFNVEVDDSKTVEEIKRIIVGKHISDSRYGNNPEIMISTIETIGLQK